MASKQLCSQRKTIKMFLTSEGQQTTAIQGTIHDSCQGAAQRNQQIPQNEIPRSHKEKAESKSKQHPILRPPQRRRSKLLMPQLDPRWFLRPTDSDQDNSLESVPCLTVCERVKVDSQFVSVSLEMRTFQRMACPVLAS